MIYGKKLTIIHRSGKYPPLSPTLRWIIGVLVMIYHTSWLTSGPKGNFISDNIPTEAILLFFEYKIWTAHWSRFFLSCFSRFPPVSGALFPVSLPIEFSFLNFPGFGVSVPFSPQFTKFLLFKSNFLHRKKRMTWYIYSWYFEFVLVNGLNYAESISSSY